MNEDDIEKQDEKPRGAVTQPDMDVEALVRAVDPQKAYLGSVAVTTAMVQTFLSGVADVYREISNDERPQQEWQEAVTALITPLLAPLTGNVGNTVYTPVKGWNAPEGGLPLRISIDMGLTGTAEDLITALFWSAVVDLVKVMDSEVDMTEDDMKAAVDDVITSYAARLAGAG